MKSMNLLYKSPFLMNDDEEEDEPQKDASKEEMTPLLAKKMEKLFLEKGPFTCGEPWMTSPHGKSLPN